MQHHCDIGLIGLAVMGQNLVLNMSDHGYKVAVYNRTTSKVDDFLANAAQGHTNIFPAYSIKELIDCLASPRKVMLMVKAGEVVDKFIGQLLPYLEAGDVIIDGGNSLFTDTNRRVEELGKRGILFVGTGV
ncbi:MAG: NAD(P)-binding domain-containing protein, partial [Sphaerochaetaceae bacterium]